MKGEEIGASCEEGYMPNGIRKNFFEKERGSKRAVDMLLKKLNGEHFVTEYPMPSFDRVAPNPAIKDLSKATIALCTSGGIVPKGNPDHIESSSASHYGEYSMDGVDKLYLCRSTRPLTAATIPVYANEDPDRVLPVDVMREFEQRGQDRQAAQPAIYTTVGNGTAVASAKAFAAEYAQKLKKAGVDGRNHDLYLRHLHSLRCNDGKGDRACGYPRGSYVHCNPHFHDRWRQPDCSHHRHTSPPGQPQPLP